MHPNYQKFIKLYLQSTINQPQDQSIAHPKRKNAADILCRTTAIAKHGFLAHNICAAYMENGWDDPVKILQDWKSKNSVERMDILNKASLIDGIQDTAMIYLYGQDPEKNKFVPSLCEGEWQWGEIYKSIKGIDALNKDINRVTMNFNHQFHLLQIEQVQKKCLTFSFDDCSVQRDCYNTLNNTRISKFMMAKPSSGDKTKTGYKTSSCPKDQAYLFVQSTSFEVLFGIIVQDDDENVIEYNTIGGGSAHLCTVAPKILHKGDQGDLMSIWLHIQCRDNGTYDKYILFW
eukprot:288448_1